MENTGKIGADGVYDIKFDGSLVMTAKAGLSDPNDSSVGVDIRINVGKELLAAAVKSGSPEAVQIVQGLLTIAPLLEAAFTKPTAPGA